MSVQGGGGKPGKFTGEETIIHGAPQSALTESIQARRTAKAASGSLPTLHVLRRTSTTKYPIRPSVYMLSVGASREESTVTLMDKSIAGKQLVILRLGGEWVFMDCGVQDLVWFNGVRKRQHIEPAGCRVTIRVGGQFLLFVSPPEEMEDTATVNLKRSLAQEMPDEDAMTAGSVKVTVRDEVYETKRKVLLIGTHELCDIVCKGDIRPFHAQVVWTPDGVMIEPLGNYPLHVGGQEVSEPVPVERDMQMVMGTDKLRVSMEGDILMRCQEMFGAMPETGEGFALTALANSEAGSISLEHFYLGKPLIVGRGESCDITLPDSSVSREHAQLIPSNKSFMLIDNYSANGTYLNGEEISKARVRAGDILEFGNSYFLVHYTDPNKER